MLRFLEYIPSLEARLLLLFTLVIKFRKRILEGCLSSPTLAFHLVVLLLSKKIETLILVHQINGEPIKFVKP